jgi:hypothetical protein
MTDKNSFEDTWKTAYLYQNGCGNCGEEWRSREPPDECPQCGKEMSGTDEGTIPDFTDNAENVHVLDLPSGKKQFTDEDMVFLKEFFAELEMIDDGEE